MTPDTQLAYQDNFFDLVPQPDNTPHGLPTRTISTFWRQDILATSIQIRNIFGRHTEEDFSLNFAWEWINKGNNRDKLDVLTDAEGDLNSLPIEVLLNFQTVYFFTMQNDFKRHPMASTFEPYVAFSPTSADFDRDLRVTTFDYIEGIKAMPLEVHRLPSAKKADPFTRISQRKLISSGIDEKTLDFYGSMDALTWVALTQYFLSLKRREDHLLNIRFPIDKAKQARI